MFKNKHYDLMKFWGYATRDLDEASLAYKTKFKKEPEAFMVRSPFLIRGSLENKRKMVVAPKYGGSKAVYIPLILDKRGLETALDYLGQASQRVYYERRRAEAHTELEDLKRQDALRQYSRHCNYCGTVYVTDVYNVEYHCPSSACRMKHKEYLAELEARKRERRLRERERAVVRDAKELLNQTQDKLPEFTLESVASRSLQGWVYFVEAANGFVKIGRSEDPSRRFYEFVTASPIPLWLRHTVFSDNYVLAEGSIHHRLAEYRRHGEWFELPEEIFDWCLGLDHYDLDDA